MAVEKSSLEVRKDSIKWIGLEIGDPVHANILQSDTVHLCPYFGRVHGDDLPATLQQLPLHCEVQRERVLTELEQELLGHNCGSS